VLAPRDVGICDRVTELALAAQSEKTIHPLVDIHLAALKAAKQPECRSSEHARP